MSDRADRDLVLEQALATLTPPPVRARFHERLWERVDAVEQVDAVETPLLMRSLEAPAPGERFHERLWDRIDAAEQVESIEARPVEHPGAGHSRRWAFRRPRLAAGVLAAAAVAVWLAVSLIGLPAGREEGILSGPPPAVAQVIENVRLRLDSVRSLSAAFIYQRAGAPVYRARMVATSDGRTKMASIAGADGSWKLPAADATLADTPGLRVEVTSMPDGTRTEAWNSGKGLTVARMTGLAPGPPDALGTGLFPAEYAGQMSALAIAGSKVTSSTYGGRPVLVVSAPAGPAAGRSAASDAAPRFDRVSMTIDRQTWLPVRVVRTYRGDTVESWAFRDVELDPPLTTADFAVQLPSSAQVTTGTDQGFRRLSLQKAGAAVKGRLYVPETLPEGFELSLAAVKTPEAASQPLAPGNGSSVVSLVYRRGFRSVVITTRSVGGAAIDPADDPFAGSSTYGTAGTRHVVLHSGGLAGGRAFVSTHPLELPHLWLVRDGLLVTVAGDVTRRELLQIAGSLETYGAWRTRQVFTAYANATRAYDLSALSDLYSAGITIGGRPYPPSEMKEALIANSEWTDYFVSGKATAPFIGDGTGVWEAWPGPYPSSDGQYEPEAIAEVVTTRGDKVVREDFYLVSGPSRPANEPILHPTRVSTPLGPSDTAAAAKRIALACAAALRAKDAARLAGMSARRVAFLDIDYGDGGGRAALLRRYERMFGFPADLAFARPVIASGPGWAALRWTASSRSLGYQKAPGLTVLEIRDGKVVRETLYCARDRMPFR